MRIFDSGRNRSTHVEPLRMRLLTLLTATACLVLVAASAAVAAPEYRNERVFFECDGTTKVDDVNQAALGEGVPGWSTTAPTQSVQGGAGCGSTDTAFSVTVGGVYGGTDALWEGTFTGNLDTIRIEGHVLASAGARVCGDITVNGTVTIDGTSVFLEELDTLTTLSGTGASHSAQLAINGIGLVDDEDGPGTDVHEISVMLSGAYVDCQNGALPWVWGTTEVPAGLEFNADTSGLPGVGF